jgi:hypothetical protein
LLLLLAVEREAEGLSRFEQEAAHASAASHVNAAKCLSAAPKVSPRAREQTIEG